MLLTLQLFYLIFRGVFYASIGSLIYTNYQAYFMPIVGAYLFSLLVRSYGDYVITQKRAELEKLIQEKYKELLDKEEQKEQNGANNV